MFLQNGAKSRWVMLAAFAVGMSGSLAQAATIGQWSSNASDQVWASTGNFKTLYAGLTGNPGHTVESPEAITTANLSNNQFFVVGNPSTGLTNPEMTALVNWVHSGGILLLFAGPSTGGPTSASVVNAILTTLGKGNTNTQMKVNTSSFVGTASQLTGGHLIGPDPAVTNIPGNANLKLSFYQSYMVSGGTALADSTLSLNNALRVDKFQLGKVYVFGERFDADYNVKSGTTNSNLALFIGLMAQQNGLSGGDPLDTPEPATIGLTGLALAGVFFWSRRKSR